MPPATASPPADAGRLLRELTAARVLADGQATQVVSEFRAAGVGRDDAGLVDYLVGAGLLTPYQADRALAGDAAKLALGPYLLLEPVGMGSLGTVYRAVRRDDRARYAVKLLPLRSMWNVLQAKRQVRAFAGLPPHPAVVPFMDVDTAAGSHYLVWPFVEGETFEALVRRAGPLPPASAAALMAQVADGLAVCHRHGIAHGLLKPSNLMLGPDRAAHILDLGVGAILSENIAEHESMLDTISTAATALGAMECAAPETFTDPTARTPAGDVYSFGCVLYFLLTGVYPFPDGNAVDKIIAHQTQRPVPVRTRSPRVPAGVAELVERLMSKTAADRPADLLTVRDALRRAASESTVPPAPAASPAALPVPAAGPPSADAIDFNLNGLVGTSIDVSIVELGLAPAPTFQPLAPVAEETVLAVRVRDKSRPDFNLPQPVAWATPTPEEPRGRPRMKGTPGRGPLWVRLLRLVCPWVAARDVVQFTVVGPPAFAPGQTARVQVYAHPPAAFNSVRTLSRAFQPDTEVLAGGYTTRAVARGRELGLNLVVANAGVAKPLVRFTWIGQTKPWAFDVYVPWESPAGRSPAVLVVGLGSGEVARIAFDVDILPRSG